MRLVRTQRTATRFRPVVVVARSRMGFIELFIASHGSLVCISILETNAWDITHTQTTTWAWTTSGVQNH